MLSLRMKFVRMMARHLRTCEDLFFSEVLVVPQVLPRGQNSFIQMTNVNN